MLEVDDIRETKVFQEAMEEGLGKGRESVARRMLERNFAVEQIADATGMSIDAIHRLKVANSEGSPSTGGDQKAT